MLKFISYTFIFIVVFVFILAHSPHLSGKMSSFFNQYANNHGDLYKLSCLPQFKIEKEKCGTKFINTSQQGRCNLMLLGDSYFGEIMEAGAYFTNVSQVHYINWNYSISIPKFNAKTKNVLLVETVERNIVQFPGETTNITFNNSKNDFVSDETYRVPGISKYFNLRADDRLQQLLFFDPVSMFFKGIKAQINKDIFGKIDKAVVLSSDGKNIYYAESFDNTFSKVSDAEVDAIARRFNEIGEHYKKMGFDEVYFTIAPNKESIVSPGFADKQYNHVIERVRDNPKLKMPFIDIYSPLKEAEKHEPVFFPSDTHWNCKGQKMFMDYVNQHILLKYAH